MQGLQRNRSKYKAKVAKMWLSGENYNQRKIRVTKVETNEFFTDEVIEKFAYLFPWKTSILWKIYVCIIVKFFANVTWRQIRVHIDQIKCLMKHARKQCTNRNWQKQTFQRDYKMVCKRYCPKAFTLFWSGERRISTLPKI